MTAVQERGPGSSEAPGREGASETALRRDGTSAAVLGRDGTSAAVLGRDGTSAAVLGRDEPSGAAPAGGVNRWGRRGSTSSEGLPSSRESQSLTGSLWRSGSSGREGFLARRGSSGRGGSSGRRRSSGRGESSERGGLSGRKGPFVQWAAVRWAAVRWAAARRVILEHALITDAVLALLVGVVSAPWLATTDPSLHSWLLQAALLVPLAWRRRYPSAVFGLVSAIAFVQWFVGVELVADLSLLVALSTVATYRPRWAGVAAAGILEVGAVMASLRWSLAGSWPRSLVFLTGLIAAGLLLGTNLRARRDLVAGLTQRAERLERERDQQALLAVAAERTRIAREMHDVIGHSLAVMVSLADGASAKIDTDPARAASAIANVSELGRQALGETRRLLGVLRDDELTDGLAPQPDLDRLADLAAQARDTGLRVVLDRQGDLGGLSAGVELAVYRIAQEAITNTLRHADAPTTVTIRVASRTDGVVVEVTDDGRVVGGAPDDSGRGHGLVGMRERAALYAGTLTAGPEGDGWTVRARLRTVSP